MTYHYIQLTFQNLVNIVKFKKTLSRIRKRVFLYFIEQNGLQDAMKYAGIPLSTCLKLIIKLHNAFC